MVVDIVFDVKIMKKLMLMIFLSGRSGVLYTKIFLA